MSELEGLLRASILIARASNRARAAEEELGRLRAENAWLLAQLQTLNLRVAVAQRGLDRLDEELPALLRPQCGPVHD